MKGCGDVDDALARTGFARGQRCALPTVAAFAQITTARNHDDQLPPMEAAAEAAAEEPGWVRFTSATQAESGSDLSRR
jgi:hypothetical protein